MPRSQAEAQAWETWSAAVIAASQLRGGTAVRAEARARADEQLHAAIAAIYRGQVAA